MQSKQDDKKDEQVAASAASESETAQKADEAAEVFSAEQLETLLSMPQVIDAIFANEKLCNEIIARFLQELGGQKSAPVVGGHSALSPGARPQTLGAPKKIGGQF